MGNSQFIRSLRTLFFCLAAVAVSSLITPSVSLASDKPAHKSSAKESSKGKKKKRVERVKDPAPVGGSAPINDKVFDAELLQSTALDAVMIVDTSRSMQRTDPGRLRNQGAKLFFRFLGDGDRLALIQFDREASIVQDLIPVTPSDLTPLDKLIDGLPAEGGFTNLEAPIALANKILEERGRPDSVRCIILLSDGKMDPHPSQGTPQELIQRTLEQDLPKLRGSKGKLYTLALSEESDKELLNKFATEGGGASWYTPTAEQIHLKYSDLFLSLKKPQVLPIEAHGFEIDSGVKEATFYITRKDTAVDVSLVDPSGKLITSPEMPSGVKWFKGEFFDVITISQPAAGRWQVKGIENPEGFATLVTDLKLQVRWPEQVINAGDAVLFAARLSEGEKTFEAPAISDAIFYNYKILRVDTGAVISGGVMLDDGSNGDAAPGDRIFSATVTLEEEGEYRALVAVTAPTFTRQQQIPFTVSGSAIELSLVDGEEHGARVVHLKLLERGLELTDPKVKLVAKLEGEKDGRSISVERDEDQKGIYNAELSSLEKPGTYEIYALLTGTENKKAVTFSSNVASYVVETPPPAPPHEPTNLPIYIGVLLLAAGWAGGMGYYVLKQFARQKTTFDSIQPYEPEPALLKQISDLNGKIGERRREADPVEIDLLAPLSEDGVTAPSPVVDAESPAVATTESVEPPAEETDQTPETEELVSEEAPAEEQQPS